MTTHTPLSTRQSFLSHDVSEAIERAVGDYELPVALHKTDVCNFLIAIAQEMHDGEEIEVRLLTPIARASVGREFLHKLSSTGVFQAGYKRYEASSKNIVVPVTDYFFKVVYNGGTDLDGCLAGMTVEEVRNSLPKRGSSARDAAGDVIREDGEVVIFGEIAGIVAFPANSRDHLLMAWLQRQAATTDGMVRAQTNRIGYAVGETRPQAARVKEIGREFMRETRRALHPLRQRPKPVMRDGNALPVDD